MSSDLTIKGKRAPVLPELDDVSPSEWESIYYSATELGYRVLGNKEDAFEATNNACLALCSTHRYDPARHKSFRRHFLNLVRIECKNLQRDGHREDEARERMHEANDGDAIAFQQRELSPEQMMSAREEDEQQEKDLHRLRARLRKLHKSVAYNQAAVALLEYWAVYGDDRPIPQVAALMGYPADTVYEAKQLIERKAATILDEEEGDDE